MSKHKTTSKSPVLAPGASPQPPIVPQEEVPVGAPPVVQDPPQDPALEPVAGEPLQGEAATSSEPPPAPEPAKDPTAPQPHSRLYRVRSRFEGFREDVLNENDEVEATEEEAAFYIGKDGVLELLPEE